MENLELNPGIDKRDIRNHSKPKLQSSPNNVLVAFYRVTVVLPQVINFSVNMLVEVMSDPNVEPVAHPCVKAPVVENLIRHEPIELGVTDAKGVLNLQPISISSGINWRMTNPALE